jgi:hypothetical protein
MSNVGIRRLFVGVIVVLVAQYVVVGVVGLYAPEPWPALCFRPSKAFMENRA